MTDGYGRGGGVPGNIGAVGSPPGGQYLGLGPAGYYLGYELFGRKRDEQIQQQALQRLVESLSLMQPTERERTVTETVPSLVPPSVSRATLGPEQQFPMAEPTDINWLTPGYEPPTQIPPNFLQQPNVPLPPERTVSQRPSLQQEALLRSLEGTGALAPPPPTSPQLPTPPLEIEAQRRTPDISVGKTAPWPYGVPPGLEDLLTVPNLPEPKEFAGEPEFAPQVFRAPAVGGATLQTPPPDIQQQRTVRETMPGKSWIELLQQRPDLRATLVSPQFAQATNMQAEMVGRQAVLAYQRDRAAGMSMEDALAKHGDKMAISEQGRQVLAQEEKLAGTLDKRAKALKEQAQAKREEENRQFLLERADELEASGDAAGAFQARLIARDPKAAEEWRQFEEQRTKAKEAKKPVVIDGIPYEEVIGPDGVRRLRRVEGTPTPVEKPIMIENVPYEAVTDASGQRRLQRIPGTPEPVKKPFYDGIGRGEALAIANDPTRSPEERRIAGLVAAELQSGAEKVAAAGAVKPTQASIEKQTQRFIMETALDEVDRAVQEHPEWIDWPKAGYYAGLTKKIPGTDLAPQRHLLPRGYEEFYANLSFYTAEKLHELAGSALTPGEIQRYAAFLPALWQTGAQFRANLQVGRRMMRAAAEYHAALQAGTDPEVARAKVRDILAREYQSAVKAAGGKPPAMTAEDFKRKKELGP